MKIPVYPGITMDLSLRFSLILSLIVNGLSGQVRIDTLYPAAWSANSVNAVIFRKNSLTSNAQFQFVSFYDTAGHVIVGRRTLGSGEWQWKRLEYKGRVGDAHNCISIQLDGHGYLHLAWDHHNNPLNYIRSVSPGALDFEPMQAMTGKNETKVTYPEFYRLPDGNILFLYRDGSSGNGNLVLNQYDCDARTWFRLHDVLIDGEGERNAYWQAAVDKQGGLHLSWTWRETPDVASNHDLCYAVSRDGGRHWEKSNGQVYRLPITAATAEYVRRIPQRSELINQTSMTCDMAGRPYIASYWKEPGERIPQYHMLFMRGKKWISSTGAFRESGFSLQGLGTRSIPISRPQILTWGGGRQTRAGFLFRDQERDNRPSLAYSYGPKFREWTISDLDEGELDHWEPTIDPDLWGSFQVLNLFLQKVQQRDSEGIGIHPGSPVRLLEWIPPKNKLSPFLRDRNTN